MKKIGTIPSSEGQSHHRFQRPELWRQLADPRRPVAERSAQAGPMGWAGARTQQVVTGVASKERATPIGVAAGVGDVLAGDPDRVPVHGSRAVISPTRPRRVAHLRFIAGKAVVLRLRGRR